MKPILISFLLLLAAPAQLSPAWADDETVPPVSFMTPGQLAPYQATIARVQDYLTALTTVSAEFNQTAPDGSLATGKFYLKRPGKMRWQYNPPTPILIVSSGRQLVFYDYELEQVSYIPLTSSLIGFLAQDKISFDDKSSVGIVSLEDKADIIRINLAEREKPDEGQLQLEFTDKPLQLKGMGITDATHQVTSVSLGNALFGGELNKELFVFRDPRKPRQH